MRAPPDTRRFGVIHRAWIVAVFLVGCAAVPVDPTDPQIAPPDDYEDTLELWTRGGKYYEGLAGRLMVKATWLSLPFVRSQIAYRREHEALSDDESGRLLAAAEARALEEVTFFVAVHSAEWEWNHLERGESGVFRLRLRTADGAEREPSRIERVPASDARSSLLYPYLLPLWIGYRVSFPAVSEGRPFAPRPGPVTLLVTGTPGHVSLDWQTR